MLLYLEKLFLGKYIIMKNKDNLEHLKIFISYLIFNDRQFFSLIVVYGVIISLLNLALPLSIQVLITSIIYTAQITPVLILGLILLFLISFSALLTILQKFLIEIYKRNSFVRIVSDILLKAIYSNYKDFKLHNSSDLSGRYFEIFNLQRNAAELIVEGLLVFLTIIVSFILSSFYHPYFFILNIIILFIIWLSWKIFTTHAIYHAFERSAAKFAVFAWVSNIFKMNNFFKTQFNKNYALDKGANLINNYIKARCNYWRVSFSQLIILTLLYIIITVVLVIVGSILVIQGQLSLGQLVAAEILYTTSLYGVSKLNIYYDKYYNLIASIDEISNVFLINNENLEHKSDSLFKDSYFDSNVIINFDNVSYHDDLGKHYLFNFSLYKQKLNFILITNYNIQNIVIHLIHQYLNPYKGIIEFYGVNTSYYDQHYIRDKICVINDVNIFESTVEEFINFGLTSDRYNHINNLLEITGLIEVINNLPKGYETFLKNDGYPLDENHIITLKIVKTILVNPEIILISDIFDRIDKEIQKNIIAYIKNNTTITLCCFSKNYNINLRYDKFFIFDNQNIQEFDDIIKFKNIVKTIFQEY